MSEKRTLVSTIEECEMFIENYCYLYCM